MKSERKKFFASFASFLQTNRKSNAGRTYTKGGKMDTDGC